ncbi:MAG: tRNA (adenosine(37)-N6)-dimethylallyltransferase MiaA, partial [Erysipelotrichaceae bacterium]|nr:tRNA (adenosine(37)-N6)-dimethylallyltransferase MiaA [Erysipelotrichaceae bacterium]
LAKELDGEIVSADSMQVYRKMDIGTAKVTREEMEGVPHYLVDIQDYGDPYNVKIFQAKCREAIEQIASKGKLPILCGGTGLYLKAALYDYVFEDEEEDKELADEISALSTEQILEELRQKDPECLEKIHPNNRRRLERALMICRSGKNKSDREKEQNHQPVYNVFWIGLNADKKLVDERIDARVEKMFAQGLTEEVADLFSNPETWTYSSFQGIGYKEFREYFENQASLEEVKEKIKIHSRQYAKRQMTWFRHQMPVQWFHLADRKEILSAAKEWYEQSESAL